MGKDIKDMTSEERKDFLNISNKNNLLNSILSDFYNFKV